MKNIQIILKTSINYPKALLHLNIPPEFLFAIGNLELLHTFSVGIVGARICSEESKQLTRQLVNELCENDITIISGMAYGIDQVAHETCMQNHGKTIAIIGSGFDIAKKRKLFYKILENDGLIISEYFPDIPAFKYNFPRRNKILVALSKAIVAVETHIDSGTMITAKESLFQNVPLFTFPGGVSDKKYLGNNLLLTQGAVCITSPYDLMRNLNQLYTNKHFVIPHGEKKSLNISKESLTLYTQLAKEPQSINTLAIQLNMPISAVQSQLTMLELEGLVYKQSNKYYCIKA